MAQAYSDPTRESDPYALPDVEVFYLSKLELAYCQRDVWYSIHNFGDDANLSEIGWYWWSCFPGCLPDSEPFGPFATEAEALADAQEVTA
jgi:hypothetical protein